MERGARETEECRSRQQTDSPDEKLSQLEAYSCNKQVLKQEVSDNESHCFQTLPKHTLMCTHRTTRHRRTPFTAYAAQPTTCALCHPLRRKQKRPGILNECAEDHTSAVPTDAAYSSETHVAYLMLFRHLGLSVTGAQLTNRIAALA